MGLSETCFLHARGGVSFAAVRAGVWQRLSPRAWRCFYVRIHSSGDFVAFSTRVAVFPLQRSLKKASISFLHARGGVSRGFDAAQKLERLSPRAWRCFFDSGPLHFADEAFSTRVEVFPQASMPSTPISGFLHARGGVSVSPGRTSSTKKLSPRAWRCLHFPNLYVKYAVSQMQKRFQQDPLRNCKFSVECGLQTKETVWF